MGAARLRFRPVTETLGVLGQADAVVSASSDERMILLYTGPLARDQVGPGFPTWWPGSSQKASTEYLLYTREGGGGIPGEDPDTNSSTVT